MGDRVDPDSRTNFLVGRLQGASACKATNQISSARKCLFAKGDLQTQLLERDVKCTKDNRGVQRIERPF